MPVNIVVVGLGFGEEFVPIYRKHPNLGRLAVCEPNLELRTRVAAEKGVDDAFATIEDALADERYDAFHIATPVPLHVEMSKKVLGAGRHCACAVVMATTLDGIDEVLEAQRNSKTNYMMMETCVYSREYLFAKELRDSGKLGTITFLRGLYPQDLSGAYPRYWWSTAPMHYATHVIGPILAIADTTATQVNCLGSGRLADDIQQPGGNPFPLETGIFRLAKDSLAAEVTRSWFQVARGYTESFSVYGDKAGFEWQQIESEEPIVYELEALDPNRRWRDAIPRRVEVPYRPDLLPVEIQEFSQGGHGGSHPHLVHEFITSIVERRSPWIDAVRAAEWTAPGICAHESALKEGATVKIPNYR